MSEELELTINEKKELIITHAENNEQQEILAEEKKSKIKKRLVESREKNTELEKEVYELKLKVSLLSNTIEKLSG